MKVKIVKRNAENSANFYKIPKFIFDEEPYKHIDNTAKLLYGIYLETITLSDKNNWIDSDGQKYIIYPQGELTALLNCSAPTLRRAIKELENVKLIRSCKLGGVNQANRIYITTF